MPLSSPQLLGPRLVGPVNWLGLRVLAAKEIRRFTKIMGQTVIAPLVTTLLYYLVFDIAMGAADKVTNGVSYMAFLTPGLIMMSMAQNAFTGTSSSMVISKVQGNIVDVLMAPLSPIEFVLGYTTGGTVRGLIVGLISVIPLAFLLQIGIAHPLYLLYHAVMGSTMLALLGLIGGIWSNRFDHLAVVQNFIIGPATFLSGTFYSARRLPETWQVICHFNPFFYMIDGFRYGFVGVHDGTLVNGVAIMAAANLLLVLIAYRMIASGYKLKS